MKRIDAIEQLSEIQYNIESVELQINEVKRSDYYTFWGWGGGEARRKRDLVIKEKCLAYWKRKFNRVALPLMYNL